MSNYDPIVLADNPVGYWPLSETSGTVAADLSVNAVNGAYVSAPTLGQAPIALELGASAVFSGTSSMQTPAEPYYGFTTGSYSVEAWINPTTVTGFQEFISTDQYVRFLLSNANLQSYIGGTLVAASSTNLVAGTSYHVVLTTDNVAQTTNIYINGVLDTVHSNLSTINPDQTPVALFVGSLDGAGTHQYGGNVSNVALYATALTPTQVLAHYHAGIGPSGLVPNVINMSAAIAEATIIAAGFTVGAIGTQPDAIIIAGNVDAQNPAGGATAPTGYPVNLTLSSGLPGLTIPDLFGMTQTDAIILLLSLGLVPGAIGSAPSKFVAPGEVQAQNPSAGNPAAPGAIVSFVLSTGIPAVGVLFDFEATVISQYANSPTILQLVSNLNQYVDQSQNFANFFNFVWNVDTAQDWGLDIWGVIVGVSRLLQIPNTTDYVGFYMPSESQPDQDWQPMGSNQPPGPAVGGALYTGYNATDTYLLPDDAYRQLILAKAFANICTTTAPAINQILQNLYGPGSAWVLNTGPMAISYNLSFTPTAIQLAILEQSGVIPTPPGVSVVINTNV